MTALPVSHPRPRPRSRVDHASVVLLRAVMADGWHPESAGRELALRLDHDRLLLELLRARVARKLLGRPSQIDVRAQATLDQAIALVDDHHDTIPLQRSGGTRA